MYLVKIYNLSIENTYICFLIKFLFLYFQATEVEKARAIAKRALSTIDTKEEQEKLNVWTAFLNLENLYGTKVNSLNITFIFIIY